ncbi:interferon lambda-1 [Carlito syrichta]|uniref:Interferon lambda-1 n=1 Tax=Carlito syrichta TaxID=1868482 RepID=A0A1U7TH95_CARSF|nr:interferon lambda-1 [Carlito syrichta]
MAAVWITALMTVMLGLARAGPVPTSRSATPGRNCHIDRFKSLPPGDLEDCKKAKDALEESLLLKDTSCSSRLLPRNWDLRKLPVWQRPMVLEAELALTLKILDIAADTTLGDVLNRPLHMLSYIHSQLRACVSPRAQPTAGPKPQGRLLHWLQQLQEAPEKESPGCLQASIMFNLFRLLTWDLKCVASGETCI